MVVMFQSKKLSTMDDLETMHVVRLKMLELQDLADSIYKRCITRYEKETKDEIKAVEIVEDLYAKVVGDFEVRQVRSGRS